MAEGNDDRDIRDAVVRHSSDIKTLFTNDRKRDVEIKGIWSKIWFMFLMMMGAQTMIIGVGIAILMKGM